MPDAYLDAMAAAPAPPVWINLEYLSAEPWVDSAHGLPSPQPRLPLTRYFWFPGFTPRHGGLLREARACSTRARHSGGAARRRRRRSQIVAVLLREPALPALLDAWADGDERDRLRRAGGRRDRRRSITWLRGDVPHAGQSRVTRPRSTLDVIPFVDAGRVRPPAVVAATSTSCAARIRSSARSGPRARFVWHIYPQADDAHRVKLDAFLARYTAELPSRARIAVTAFWHAFNDGDGAALPSRRGRRFAPRSPTLGAHGRAWADALAALPELTAGLVKFARRRL